jgi:competence protein ComEC
VSCHVVIVTTTAIGVNGGIAHDSITVLSSVKGKPRVRSAADAALDAASAPCGSAVVDAVPASCLPRYGWASISVPMVKRPLNPATRTFSVMLLLCLLAGTPLFAQTLRIYTIDVEQADAALLVMPNGKTLLIDSGKNGHGKRIKAVMDRAGVTQTDVFVNSHYHEDHFGGIDDLVDMGVPVLEAFDRGDKSSVPAAKKAQKTYKDYIRTVGEDARPLRRGDTIALDPLVTITCISSGGVVTGETNPVPGGEENDLSVSVLVSFDGFLAFFGGDTEGPTEAKIATRDLLMNIDFLKASHHGSHSSSSLAFMNDARPTVVVISNGSDATYKHSRQVTLNTYAAMPNPPQVFQTNKCFRPAPCANVPDSSIADPQSIEQDGTILTTLDAATHTYTLSYGATLKIFTVKAPAPGSMGGAPQVVVGRLLPNPAGADEQFESVTILNKGKTSQSLTGWLLEERRGLRWVLNGSLAAGQSRTFRNGQPMVSTTRATRSRWWMVQVWSATGSPTRRQWKPLRSLRATSGGTGRVGRAVSAR